MSIYSERLFIGLLANTWATFFTATHATIVLRDLELVNGGSSTVGCSLTVTQAAPAVTAFWFSQLQLAANEHFEWQGRLVLAQGDSLGANPGGPNVNCILSGYVFDT